MNNNLSNISNPEFGVPEGYFEQFEDSVFARLSEEKLKTMVDSPGFTVPKDYLASVEEKVLNRLHVDQQPVKVITPDLAVASFTESCEGTSF